MLGSGFYNLLFAVKSLCVGDMTYKPSIYTSLISVRGMYVVRVFRIRAVVAEAGSFGGVSATFR